MFLLRGILISALSLALTTVAFAAPNTGYHRRHRVNNGIQGTVVQVHHDRLHRNAGWIKLRHGTARYYGRSRGSSAFASVSRRRGARSSGVITVNVNNSTRFQRLGQRGRGAGRIGFGAIHRGERVRVYLGSQSMARLVDVLPYSYYRTRHRYGYGNHQRRYYGRRTFYRRHPLVLQRALVRSGRYPVRVNRPIFVNRPSVNRWVPHPLIRSAIVVQQHRRAVEAQLVKHASQHLAKSPPKHPAVVHKPTPPNRIVAHRPPPPKHTAARKPSPKPHRSAPRPHSSAHRRK